MPRKPKLMLAAKPAEPARNYKGALSEGERAEMIAKANAALGIGGGGWRNRINGNKFLVEKQKPQANAQATPMSKADFLAKMAAKRKPK